ncbi:MAG: DUF4089 domain-containing protein [Betaproteobacteria bacterium]|nr:DUF4089 domain-containing protein [Betaproteobacteria bacterium]
MKNPANDDVSIADVKEFVRVGCAVQGIDLDEAAVGRVVEVFARNARIAALVTDWPLPDEQDPAALLRLD